MNETTKEYRYTNTMGYHKALIVQFPIKENGKYFCTLWSRDTGDLCGSGELTKKEIDEMLRHYGLKADF